MSRTLLVFRHAKAARPQGVADVERPLAGRGRRDAEAAGRWLRGQGYRPDLVVCSPSRRTRETWELAAAGLQAEPGDGPVPVRYDERIFEASVGDLLGVVQDTPEDVSTLLLVGHNPATQGLALALADDASAPELEGLEEEYPTCGVAVLDVHKRWSTLEPGGATLTGFAVPRD